MNNYKIEVETLSYGQPRPYSDSVYKYKVKVENMSKYTVECFCRQWVYPHKILSKEEIEKMGKESVYFYGTSSFEEIKENEYLYTVYSPYAD